MFLYICIIATVVIKRKSHNEFILLQLYFLFYFIHVNTAYKICQNTLRMNSFLHWGAAEQLKLNHSRLSAGLKNWPLRLKWTLWNIKCKIMEGRLLFLTPVCAYCEVGVWRVYSPHEHEHTRFIWMCNMLLLCPLIFQVVPPQHHRNRGRAAPVDPGSPRQFLGPAQQEQPGGFYPLSQVGWSCLHPLPSPSYYILLTTSSDT